MVNLASGFGGLKELGRAQLRAFPQQSFCRLNNTLTTKKVKPRGVQEKEFSERSCNVCEKT